MPFENGWDELQLISFILALLRISTFVALWPVFGLRNVPAQTKILLALIITLIALPVIPLPPEDSVIMDMRLLGVAAQEVFLGALLGFISRLFLYVISVMGDIISISMGLSSAQILNPAMESQGSQIEQFQVILAMLFFLAINGHHIFLAGIIESFQFVKMAQPLNIRALGELGSILQMVIEIGLKLSAPVLLSLLFINVALGIMGRAVPQINVLIISFPVTILAGLVVMVLVLPLVLREYEPILNKIAETLFWTMKTI